LGYNTTNRLHDAKGQPRPKVIVKRLILGFVSVIFVVVALAAAAYWWHERPQPLPPNGEQMLAADFSLPGGKVWPDKLDVVTTGRLMHHQQAAHGMAGRTVNREQNRLTAASTFDVELPPGAMLTFDLHVPPLLLTGGRAVHFQIEAVAGGNAETVFTYEYRRDRLGEWINKLRESWQIDYGFIDRFRHFDLDLSGLAGQSVELRFTVTGQDAADPAALKRFTKRLSADYHNGFTFLTPRLWASRRRAPRDFNVVFLIVDGLRQDALSLYGYPRETMPNLAAIAGEGIVFGDVHAPSNATRNSTTAILAGRYPSTMGLPIKLRRWDLSLLEKRAFRALVGWDPAATPSLALHLSRRGYATAFVGSNPFVMPGNEIGADLGFAVNESMNLRRFDTEGISERALDFVDRNSNRPFFLYVHFNNGHGPFAPPRHCLSRVARRPGETAPAWSVEYDAEMCYADEKIAALRDRLKQRGVWDNTLFIVTADHGISEEVGHPRGHAHSLYEPETRVPLIVSLPNVLPAGERRTGEFSLLDIYPTILALRNEPFENTEEAIVPAASGGPPYRFNGRNLLDETTGARALHLEGSGIFALKDGRWKAIVKTGPYDNLRGEAPADDGKLFELYDLQTDPGETDNLAGSGLPIEAEMVRRLWERKHELALGRAAQLNHLKSRLGDAYFSVYPDRAEEAFEVTLAAGDAPRRFELRLSTDPLFGSFLGRSLAEGDRLDIDPNWRTLVAAATVPAGEQKRFAFTPFPPDAPFVVEAFVDGAPLGEAYIGPYQLAYPGPRVSLETPRDLRLLTAPEPPTAEAMNAFGIYLWRWEPKKDTGTAVGGQVEDALRNWGYVK
jgi:arylsulfatase A-like enzyme